MKVRRLRRRLIDLPCDTQVQQRCGQERHEQDSRTPICPDGQTRIGLVLVHIERVSSEGFPAIQRLKDVDGPGNSCGVPGRSIEIRVPLAASAQLRDPGRQQVRSVTARKSGMPRRVVVRRPTNWRMV